MTENPNTHRGIQIIDFHDGYDPIWIADQVADCLDRLGDDDEDQITHMVAYVIDDGTDLDDDEVGA